METIMDIELTARCVFALPLSRPHIDVLNTLSHCHYDVRCKMASSERGFLTQWRNSIDTDLALGLDPPLPIKAEFDQLDTCLKVLEMRFPAAMATIISADENALCLDLIKNFAGVARLANHKFREWQAVWAPVTV
jgi:hypothetical protein